MFINCSSCNSKYLVNSADLKPDGSMVECANCGHQWYQELNLDEKENLSPLQFSNENMHSKDYDKELSKKSSNNNINKVKNLPSTIVKEPKASIINSFLMIILVLSIVISFFLFRSNGTNILVLINFYFYEFLFNLNLIINDISKIIHQLIN